MRSDPPIRRGARRLVGLLALALAPPLASAATPVVAIVTSGSPQPFERATRAMTAALKQSALQPEIQTFDLEGDEANGSAVFARVRRTKPDVIITVGSLTTASALAESTDVPIVFSMVLYPAQSGFTGAARERMTGASLDIPPDVQFVYLRRLLPSARRVGVLFNPEETGGVVEAARGAAANRGLTLVARAVGQGDDVVGALRGLIDDVDVVWTVADSHVFVSPESTSGLILASLRSRVPLIGLSSAHVRTGALAALYCDYEDVGAQTAALALRVLRGESPASIPIATPRRVGLALNLRTADHLGVTLDADLAAEATETLH